MVAPSALRSQPLEEVVVGLGPDLALAALLAVERHVEADRVDAVLGDQFVGQIGRRVRDDSGVGIGAHWPASYQVRYALACAPMAKTLVTGRQRVPGLAPGPRARRARRRPAAARPPQLEARPPGRDRVRPRHRRRHRPARRAPGDGGRRPRLSRRRAHVAAAGRPRRRLRDQPARRPARLRGGARGRGRARRPHLERRGDRGREAEGRRRRDDSRSRSATSASPTSTPSTRPSSRRFRLAAHGLPVVIVNPTFVLGPDDPSRTSMGLVRRFCLGQIPAYVDGGAQHRRRPRRRRGPSARRRKGEVGERYILAGRNFTFDRLFADLSRISGVDPPAAEAAEELALGGLGIASRLRLPLPARQEEIVSASLWWTYRNTKAKRELGFKPRPHEDADDSTIPGADGPAHPTLAVSTGTRPTCSNSPGWRASNGCSPRKEYGSAGWRAPAGSHGDDAERSPCPVYELMQVMAWDVVEVPAAFPRVLRGLFVRRAEQQIPARRAVPAVRHGHLSPRSSAAAAAAARPNGTPGLRIRKVRRDVGLVPPRRPLRQPATGHFRPQEIEQLGRCHRRRPAASGQRRVETKTGRPRPPCAGHPRR